ncbi:MAG: hypothetical protein HPZ91_06865 [Lentisphaeria bacterium]|nr:hypothetical protein [Lentisphaeria bacterium]
MKIECPRCKQRYEVEDRYRGQRLTCEKCQAVLSIPESDSRVEALEERVNSLIERITLDNQDGPALKKMYDRAEKILTRNETIEYIALQKKLLFNISPDALVLTNRRVIVMEVGLLGTVRIWDLIWRELLDARLDIGVFRSRIILSTTRGDKFIMNILKLPASKAYGILQEQEERTAEERRQRSIEESRAAAGGVVVNAPGTPAPGGAAANDCVTALKQLKELLDAGLITQGEYESKRQSVLSRF